MKYTALLFMVMTGTVSTALSQSITEESTATILDKVEIKESSVQGDAVKYVYLVKLGKSGEVLQSLPTPDDLPIGIGIGVEPTGISNSLPHSIKIKGGSTGISNSLPFPIKIEGSTRR